MTSNSAAALATTSALAPARRLHNESTLPLPHSRAAAPAATAHLPSSSGDDLDLTGKVQVALTSDSARRTRRRRSSPKVRAGARDGSAELLSVVDTAVVGMGSATGLAALGPATMLTDRPHTFFG